MEKTQKSRNFWMGFAMLMFGIVIGFMFAPMKKGISIANNNGNGWGANDNTPLEDEEQEYSLDEY